MLDQARYAFALIRLVAFPIVLFWIALHPFVAFWRRMGLAATYTILLAGCVTLGVILFTLRRPLLAIEFGTGPVMWVLTAAAYGVSIAFEGRAHKHLRMRALVGVPELRGGDAPGAFFTQGIYNRVRHPRYIGTTFGYVASACFANYLFLWSALPVFVFLLHTVVLLEERELEACFGDAWREYAARVPRYLPQLRS